MTEPIKANRILPKAAPLTRQNARGRASVVEVVLKEEQAFMLKRSGMTFIQIAKELGVSKASATRLFYTALDQRSVPVEEVEEYRRVEVERLEALRSAIWKEAAAGDDDKILTALRIHDRIARILGLNAPERVELNITVKAQILAGVVKQLDLAMSEAGIPVEQQQLVAASILQGAEPGAATS